MRRWIGKFIFDLMVRTIQKLDDDSYNKFMHRVVRPEWARRVPLPMAGTGEITMFHYRGDSI